MSISAGHKNEITDHLEAIFEYATIGILITDEKGIITAVNPFALNEFGYTENELKGQKVEILIPSRYHERHSHYHDNFIASQNTRRMGINLEVYAIKKDGIEIPVEIGLSSYTRNGNKFVISFITNISSRRKSDMEIRNLNAELESKVTKRTDALNNTMQQLEISREKLGHIQSFQKALLDNAGAMIIATDKKGIIKLFNPEAVMNLGYSESELIEKYTPVIFHDKEDIAVKREELLKKYGIDIKDEFAVLVEKATRNVHVEEQFTYIRKDGTSFPVLLTVTAIRDSIGEITGYMGISIDISERSKAEKSLREALEKEKELNELKSRFVSMASHEFRTPLSTVLSSSYLIEKYTTTEEQPKREKHLQRIISSVEMLTDILNDFLSVGKIEEGKIQVRPCYFNIREMVSEVLAELNPNLKRNQKIQYLHEGSPDVFLDKSMLKHIIMNLISNAIKFSFENSFINVKTVNDVNGIMLSVKDNGMGIARDDQKHLMERFFRGANAVNIQGTGLGLHIVSKYAELMNGTVTWISELEKGTEFIITFANKTN